MPDTAPEQKWPALQKDDEGLLDDLLSMLGERVTADPYGSDESFADAISALPRGLRAMAATHWLDISLSLDSITWHFGNFGEPHLVAETEAGLAELGLDDLAQSFREAKELMVPLLAHRTEEDGDPYEILERKGLKEQGSAIDHRAWAVKFPGVGDSPIYNAWISYTRAHPENVFGS